MDVTFLLLYLLTFIVGSVLGLLVSYKKHGEIYIIQKIDIVALIAAIIGWVLLFNFALFSKTLSVAELLFETTATVLSLMTAFAMILRIETAPI